MIKKILIANRGEIACRIIRTAHKMGILCVCVYSDADANSLHTLCGDEIINIGPSPSSQSYLNIDRICDVACKVGADAVHPGYGFLSENPLFAEMLEKYNINFIGPSASSIRIMADKITSKKLAQCAGVNVVPGYMGIVHSISEAQEIAKSIGFPVIVKATAGGGGKGMRIVRSIDDMEQAFTSATNEASKSFKDGRIFIEKYIEFPRHIEIQIIADKYGNIVCLGDRECSIQRHNQKVIEETPSPFLDDKTRQDMYLQCINLAKEVNYFSVGTIEFIVDSNKQFYFLEMNTRLQVEHPVTELVTKIDLVEEMIRIASGEKLRFTQNDINCQGAAIEARIYAEDPKKNFLPSSGRIVYYSEPNTSSNVRIDSGVVEGSSVSMFYDPMIAKICSYGKDRVEAIKIMQESLNSFYIDGIANNIDFILSIFHNPVFISGNINTGFINQFYKDGFKGDILTEEIARIFAVTSLYIYCEDEYRYGRDMKNKEELSVYVNDKKYVLYANYDNKVMCVQYNHNTLTVFGKWKVRYRLLEIQINDSIYCIKVDRNLDKYKLKYSAVEALCVVYQMHADKLLSIMPKPNKYSVPSNIILSPIAGMIVKVYVKEEEEVQVGQALCVIEAMKMENVICSEVQALVKRIFFTEGSNVFAGDTIIEFYK